MVKKPVKKRQSASKASAAKTQIAVAGSIKAGRDVIIGDQYNDFRQQIANVASPGEFAAELKKLQAEIAALKGQATLTPAQAQTVEVVEGQIQQVVEEAQKAQPVAARITATLTGAKAVMDSLSGGIASAVGLGTTIAAFGQIALKLFGG